MPVSQDVTGKYNCSGGKSSGDPFGHPGNWKLSVCRKKNKLVVTDGSPFFRVSAKENGSGFNFSLSGMYAVKGVGNVDSDRNLAFSLKRNFGKQGFTVNYTCKFTGPCASQVPQAQQATPESAVRRGVFIRPCPDQLFTDSSFITTRVGGGTVASVCEDLRKSGVTDLFLGFKADHEGKGCGTYGRLLYPSVVYPGSVSFVGKDPVKGLISSCSGMKIHAWFPVFADRHAAMLAGQKAYYRRDLIDGTIEAVKDFFRTDKFDYESPIFADPSNAQVVTYQLNLLTEIMQKYPSLSGINLDYIRYSDEASVEVYGDNGSTTTKSVSWIVDSQAVTDFVKNVRSHYPNMQLSADVLAGTVRRQGVGQDGILKYLDIVMPMEYTKMGVDSNQVTGLTADIGTGYPSGKVIVDLRGWAIKQDGPALIFDIGTDITSVKSAGANGFAIFTYESFLGDTGYKSLKSVKDKIDY